MGVYEFLHPGDRRLTSETGVEYAEGEDYTLTYYQVVDGVDGEPVEVEIAKEDIKDAGINKVVATPTVNGVLCGEAWAQFRVVESLPAILGDVDGDGRVTVLDATYIQRWLEDIPIPFELIESVADTDGNENVAINDATCIQRYLANLSCPEDIGQPVPVVPV